MTTIYLTRHGKTLWNLEKRLQGVSNSELTEEGIKQAKSLGDRLDGLDIDVIYTSPIKRAYETAQILRNGKNINIIAEDRLKEINFGEYEGSTEEELLGMGKGDEISKIFSGEMDVRAPGGETLRELYNRISEVLAEILEIEKGKNVLIVTHGATLKAIVSYFKKSDEIYDTIMGQTTLSKVICKNGEFEFEFINDRTHLDDEEVKIGW
ncbi:histidine phosphatase family protein [Clostridium paraputrificum]|uniref:histidine phosphatase family protein n=1 Tax=Clostridium paraputrificum TaxID=29363 RepID=UPI003D33AD07